MTGFGQTTFDWNKAGERTIYRDQQGSALWGTGFSAP